MSSSSSSKNSGGGGKRSKRSKKSNDLDPASWECTVCTYRNRQEAFKCEMCDTRKGTSTRKPKLSSTMVEQHTIVQNFVLQQEQQHSQHLQAKQATRKMNNPAAKSHLPHSPTPTPPARASQNAESPSDHSFTSTDQSPSASKTSTPQPPPTPTPTPTPPAAGPSPVVSPPAPTITVTTPVSSLPTPPEKVKPPKPTKSADPKPVHLRNIDKNSARSLAVTVNGTTVIITDYKLKRPSQHKMQQLQSSLKKGKSQQQPAPPGGIICEQTSSNSAERTKMNGQNSRSETMPLPAPFKKRKIDLNHIPNEWSVTNCEHTEPGPASVDQNNFKLDSWSSAASPNTDLSSSTS